MPKRQVLMTKEILKIVPSLYATDGKPDTDRKVIAKFFNPCGSQTWYLLEFDQKESANDEEHDGDTLYTYMTQSGAEPELGYSSLEEFLSTRLPFGLYIERDSHFPIGKMTLAELKEKLAAGKHL